MNSAKEDFELVFSIFHDGDIVEINPLASGLELKIGITYLAKRINPEFNFFRLILKGLKQFSFSPWSDEPQFFDDYQTILSFELEISSGELSEKGLIVYCHSFDPRFSGGELSVDADSFIILKEDGDEMALEELLRICNDYWDEFGKS